MFLDNGRLFVKTFMLSPTLCLLRKGVLSSKSVGLLHDMFSYRACYFRQNMYIQSYIFGHKCIFKSKGLTRYPVCTPNPNFHLVPHPL